MKVVQELKKTIASQGHVSNSGLVVPWQQNKRFTHDRLWGGGGGQVVIRDGS